MSTIAIEKTKLAWTGERMIPHQSDSATELFHWQRYLYFRPWYADGDVVDAASGEGYGCGYAGTFAATCLGIDSSAEAVEHAQLKYHWAQFQKDDVCKADYSSADLVISFETIEHLPDPNRFLDALKSCKGRIVISTPNRKTHSPGNRLEDKPHNPYHTVEWTPSEFSDLILSHFPTRQVRFLNQEARWPGLIREGLDDNAMYTIAVVGDGELPNWPRLGIAIPTRNAELAQSAVMSFSRYYPGELEFAIVANGLSTEDLQTLHSFQTQVPNMVHVLEEPENLGYGRGANRGLEFLSQEAWFDAFIVSNDDVTPSVDFLPQMASAYQELVKQGLNPGVLGCVTNAINGPQQVDIGAYQTLEEMHDRASDWSRTHHSSATQTNRIRGLFMMISPDCLSDVGGFDPRFGIGNFEDDDHNLRCLMAGYSLWQIDGAFLHHIGSSTFRSLDIDYESNIQRNLSLILQKWNVDTFQALWSDARPLDTVYVPLTAKLPQSGYSIPINGETVDLVNQASDLEFAAYVMQRARGADRRLAVIQALEAA